MAYTDREEAQRHWIHVGVTATVIIALAWMGFHYLDTQQQNQQQQENLQKQEDAAQVQSELQAQAAQQNQEKQNLTDCLSKSTDNYNELLQANSTHTTKDAQGNTLYSIPPTIQSQLDTEKQQQDDNCYKLYPVSGN